VCVALKLGLFGVFNTLQATRWASQFTDTSLLLTVLPLLNVDGQTSKLRLYRPIHCSNKKDGYRQLNVRQLGSLRPWDYRGNCYMDQKRIQCLSNAPQHVHIYLQPFPSYSELLVGNCNFFLPPCMYPSVFNNFPVIQAVKSEVRNFSTFLHILASLGTPLGISR